MSISFFDINFGEPPTKLSLSEFIDSIEDAETKVKIEQIFDPYDEIIYAINIAYGATPVEQKPEILIHRNSSLEPETVFGGRIEMGDQYILSYLNISIPEFNKIISEYEDDLNVEGLAPIVSMMWTYSHEYFHYVRKHEDVKLKLMELEGDAYESSLTEYSFERDADMCAIAMVYRYLQRWHSAFLPDLMIRQLGLYLIFWTMRPYLLEIHGEKHLSMGLRLYELVNKLSILTEINDANQVVDHAMVEDHTKHNYSELFRCLSNCERLFIPEGDIEETSKLLKVFDKEDIEKVIPKVINRWESIRSIVQEISGTNA